MVPQITSANVRTPITSLFSIENLMILSNILSFGLIINNFCEYKNDFAEQQNCVQRKRVPLRRGIINRFLAAAKCFRRKRK